MAKTGKAKPSKALLESIETWAARYQLQNEPLIEKLIADLENGHNLKVWADSNFDQVLPLPESKSAIQNSKRINSITGIRNILVFSPVALTWASISVVTSAFSDYEKANPGSVVNFLQFWQQGFGFLSDFWKLSSVAIFDAVLVGIVILLTYFINHFTRKNIESERIYTSTLMRERTELVIELNEFFYEFKYPTSNQINRNIYSATKSLEKSLKALSKIVARLEKDIAKYPNSLKLITELKNLKKTVEKLPKK